MEKYRITDNKNVCLILSALFWGFLLFVEFKGTILFHILMLGLTLTMLRCKTDNILCPVIVHIGINVIATI